jgi:hypothetical protein
MLWIVMDNGNGNKKLVQAVLEGKQVEAFEELKRKLNIKNDSEVLRWAITYTEKRIK